MKVLISSRSLIVLIGIFCLWFAGTESSLAVQCETPTSTNEIELQLRALLDEKLAEDTTIPSISIYVQRSRSCDTQALSVIRHSKSVEHTLDESTLFRIASNTKTYTAATILRLVELGKVDINGSVFDYLPFTYRDLFHANSVDVSGLSIINLLRHTSGLPDHASDNRYIEAILNNPSRKWSPFEQLSLIFEYDLTIAPARSEFSYSDTGYVLLGRAIEQVSGLSLNHAFRKYLQFEALGITQTFIEPSESTVHNTEHRAHQFFSTFDTFTWHPSLDLYGGGGLLSTTKEMGEFLKHLLSGNVFDSPTTLELMLTIPPESQHAQFGSGIFKKTMCGEVVWGHTGFWNTFAFYDAKNGITISGAIQQAFTPVKGSLLAQEIYELLTTGNVGCQAPG